MKTATLTKLLFHTIALVHLFGLTKGWDNSDDSLYHIYIATRFLLMPTLALYFFAATSSIKNNLLKLIFVALFFSWLGDILLTYKTELNFLTGILAFLTAHVFYMIYYYKETSFKHFNLLKNKSFLAAPYALVVILFILKTFAKMNWFAIPIGIYGTVLCSMSLMALNRYRNVATISFIMTYIGSIIFVVSDFMIGYNVFAEPITNASFAIMTTYIIGQYLIVEGLIKHVVFVHKS